MGRRFFIGDARFGLVWLLVTAGSLGCDRTHRIGDDPKEQSNTKADASTNERPDGGSSIGSAGDDGTSAAQSGRGGREPVGGSSPVPPVRDPGSGDPNPPICDDLPQVVDKADLLFAIDNSGSMKEEQESLREQLPG